MSYGITLGHFLMAGAALELLAVPLMLRSVRRGNAESGERPPVAIVLFAAVATAVGLCLVALFLPEAQMVLL